MLIQPLHKSYISSQLLYIGDVTVLKTVTSTNQYLIDNLIYLKLGSVCLAETQTNGRGRHGKSWFSPCNNNLYLSFFWLFLDCNKKNSIFVLSLVISLVIGELLQELGVEGITLKWPNDIYISGHKLAGVLVEVITKFCNRLYVIIGIGINVTSMFEHFRDRREKVISLEEIGIFIDRNILAVKVINILYQSLVQFECFGFAPFFFRWLALDSCCNQSVKLLFRNRMIFGIFRKSNNHGLLLLECLKWIYSYSYVKNISLCRY